MLEAERSFAAAPQGMVLRRIVRSAHRQAGHLDEAEHLGAEVPVITHGAAQIDEDSAWVVNDHASLLYALGRPDAVDARLAALAAIPIAAAPWQISMMINRIGSRKCAG